MSVHSECPVCGNPHLVERNSDLRYQLTLGAEFVVPGMTHECPNCGHVEEAVTSSDTFKTALATAKQQTMVSLVDRLTSAGMKMSYIERAFELPSKTINRWKSGGENSAAALALLRTLVTYPFIAEVAVQKFDPIFAQTRLISEGFKYASHVTQMHGGESTMTLTTNDDALLLHAQFQIPGSQCFDPKELRG